MNGFTRDVHRRRRDRARICLGVLGSVKDNEFGRLIKQPDEIGGAETRSAYLVVPDADAVYARAGLDKPLGALL